MREMLQIEQVKKYEEEHNLPRTFQAIVLHLWYILRCLSWTKKVLRQQNRHRFPMCHQCRFKKYYILGFIMVNLLLYNELG